MENILIRKCTKKDKKGVVNVCYHTGYFGEDAEGHFQDKKLFGLMFCSYYPIFEPHNSFVAVVKNYGSEKIVAYTLSTLDSKFQEKIFKKRILWKLLLRSFLITSWRYFHDFKLELQFLMNLLRFKNLGGGVSEFYNEYPAHLHIDILEEFQHRGIGTKLISALETHLKKMKIKGVCLGTSERNNKAIPFYKKNGYKILKSWRGIDFWPVHNVASIIFGKKF